LENVTQRSQIGDVDESNPIPRRCCHFVARRLSLLMFSQFFIYILFS